MVNKTIETINRGIKELPSFDLALRIVDKSNWIGKALVFPRALLPQVKARPELAQTGVYLLLGPRPDGGRTLKEIQEAEAGQ